MQCHFCGGDMKKGITTYALNKAGYHLLIHDVPAWICKQCNEVCFEENAVEILQELVTKLDRRVNKVRQVAFA